MDKSLEVIFTETPHSEDISFLSAKINEEALGYGNAYSFAFFIKNEDRKIIAGCNGSIIFGVIYTDQVWVQTAYRNRGFGGKLMESVHRYGREKACKMATVGTISFQNSIQFYERLGYQIHFERSGYAWVQDFYF